MANVIYRIYYKSPEGEFIVYIGRTRNDLTQRLRQHFTGHPFQKKMDINLIARIDYCELKTVADMYVAEIIFINYYKPPLNVDDKAKDEITLKIDLSEINWIVWDKPNLIKKWRDKLL